MVFCWVGVILSRSDELLSLSLSSLESLDDTLELLVLASELVDAVVAVIDVLQLALPVLCGIFCAVIVTE